MPYTHPFSSTLHPTPSQTDTSFEADPPAESEQRSVIVRTLGAAYRVSSAVGRILGSVTSGVRNIFGSLTTRDILVTGGAVAVGVAAGTLFRPSPALLPANALATSTPGDNGGSALTEYCEIGGATGGAEGFSPANMSDAEYAAYMEDAVALPHTL